jgi:hypothetical protein
VRLPLHLLFNEHYKYGGYAIVGLSLATFVY